MKMGVAHPPKEIIPDGFIYIFPHDIDETHTVELTFIKKRAPLVLMEFAVERIKGNAVLRVPNLIEFEDTDEQFNLLELHNLCEAINFRYMTKNGTYKEFKFPLSCFSERYLAQFIE